MATANEEIINLVGHTPVSASDLREQYRIVTTLRAVSRHLTAGVKAGVLDRTWDGNGRYGRWLYVRKSS